MSAGIKGFVLGTIFGAWMGIAALAAIIMARDEEDE